MSRRDIYYWKCDRPAAFHGTQVRSATSPEIEAQLSQALREHFHAERVTLKATASQGNHLTWHANIDEREMFVRVENGPESDCHLEIESVVMRLVNVFGVPTPEVFGCDASRTRVAFAWQAMQHIDAPDLNHWHRQGKLDVTVIGREIGVAIAAWQGIRPRGFGPFDVEAWRATRALRGFHPSYEKYFRLRLDQHLAFLADRKFLNSEECAEIAMAVNQHRDLLSLCEGCLVHKDMALWNVLGSEKSIAAFIDFDDAISGDATDDLSLLGCFHDGEFMKRALEGYKSIRSLPTEHLRRFWLHLLRNMIVKAVIRVGAGYFERNDSFFLIGSGSSGADLEKFTRDRIRLALQGLAKGADVSIL
jgi:fructosamine-3-kinase